MKKRNIVIALFLTTIISITAFLYSKLNAQQLTFPILSQSSQLFLYHDYLYYTDYDQAEQVFRLNRTLLKDHNIGRQAETIFRCPNQNGLIELFMQKDSLYFTYKSSKSPSLSTHNTYRITPTGDCKELLLNRRMKFDLYADGIVLASFFPMETQNNLYSYQRGIFENISGDENLYYQDLIVHENSVYAIAKYKNYEDSKYPMYPTLYKIDIKTKKVSCLSKHYVKQFALDQEKNNIYYIADNNLYCINLNGTASEELVDQNVDHLALVSVNGTSFDTIIFIGKNGNGLYKIDLTSKAVDVILPPRYIIQNFIYNNNLLAIKLNNKYLGFMIIDTKGNWIHFSNKTISQFAFDGCTVIYLTNNNELYLRDKEMGL